MILILIVATFPLNKPLFSFSSLCAYRHEIHGKKVDDVFANCNSCLPFARQSKP